MNSKSSTLESIAPTARFQQLLAIGSIAIGATAMAIAAPAQAASVTGNVDFNNETGNFFRTIAPGPGDAFAVTFNPTGSNFTNPNPVNITGKSGSLGSTFFPNLGTTNGDINTPIANFQYLSGSIAAGVVYQLTSNLDFNFNSSSVTSNGGLKLTIGSGSTFKGLFNSTTSPTSVNFSILSNVGSSFTSAGSTPQVTPLVFNFSDSTGAVGGSYNISATTAVPEPFTTIGTLVGGTVALRLKKKLKSTAKS